jgi:L-histidine N-alpha-methyltransferase
MAHHLGPNPAVIEYGSGNSLKTRFLLDQLEMPATYVPVDIAREPLLDAAGSIARDYPELRITPVCADFTRPFDLPVQVSWAKRRVVYFPGSTLGNFENEQARRLLSSMRTLVGRKGAVLIGLDLKKNSRILERAYDDAAGVTAEFNLNALRHLNRELGTDFNLSAFEHRASWVEDESRIEMHLVSKRRQTVHVGEHEIIIERGEYLRTECCHKYTLEGFADLAASADLAVTRVWTDDEKRFSVQLLEPRTLQ